MASNPATIQTDEAKFFGGQLAAVDPGIDAAITAELGRRGRKLELIASDRTVRG